MKKHQFRIRQMVRLTAVLLLLPSLGCAPKVYSTLQKSYPARPEGSAVKVIYLNDAMPEGAEVLGSVEVLDNGLATNCGFLRVVELAKEVTNRAGGNALHITWHKDPAIFGSSCHQIAGDMLRYPDEKELAGNATGGSATAAAGTAEKAGLAAAGEAMTGSAASAADAASGIAGTTDADIASAPQAVSANRSAGRRGTSLETQPYRMPFTLMVNAGYAFIVSKVEMVNGVTGNPRQGFGFNAALQWASHNGIGAGLRYAGYFSSAKVAGTGIGSQRFNIHLHYVGPELVLRQEAGKRWRFHESFVLGYAAYGERLKNISVRINGFGVHIDVGAEYRLSKHLAVGLGVADYMSTFPSSEFGLDDMDEEKNQSFSYLTINGGLRILF